MTLEEKVKELYNELKPKCQAEGLNLNWEIHKALRRFRKEHPDFGENVGKNDCEVIEMDSENSRISAKEVAV